MSTSLQGHRSKTRILKFSLVGAFGIGLQLVVLACLIAIKVSYLPATLCAVESAVLHNFLWHHRFTWADRSAALQSPRWAGQLVRFHVSNGLISVVGNLLLMLMFVDWLRLNVLLANLAAISVCFVGNFLAADRWVFADPDAGENAA